MFWGICYVMIQWNCKCNSNKEVKMIHLFVCIYVNILEDIKII